MQKTFLLLLLLALFFPAFSQDDPGLKDMDKGVKYLENGDYIKADEHFRLVLKNVKVLPTNISYYFGKNSFYLKKYKQSINWLNKYIELAGTSGRFFDDAILHLKKAEEKYLLQRETEISHILDELSGENEIDCEENDKMICPVCKGEGVIIKEGNFGKTYITCPYSDNRGLLTCEEYNLLIKGELKPKF